MKACEHVLSVGQRFEASVSVWAVGPKLFQPFGWDCSGFLGGGRQAEGVRVQLCSSCGDYIGYQQPADGHLYHPLEKRIAPDLPTRMILYLLKPPEPSPSTEVLCLSSVICVLLLLGFKCS